MPSGKWSFSLWSCLSSHSNNVLFLVSVKWRGTNYTVEFDQDQTDIEKFRKQVSKLTNVLPDRMKLVMKGKTLGADGKFSDDDIKYLNGARAQLVMFGEASAVPIETTEISPSGDAATDEKMQPVDETPESTIEDTEQNVFPCGLVNLGNNCYMNSVLQAVYAMVSSLHIEAPLSYEGNNDTSLVLSFMELFEKMNTAKEPIDDNQFFFDVHRRYPFFAERGQTGEFLQHDSNEFFVQLMNSLKSVILYKEKNFIKQFFMGVFKKHSKCAETEEEETRQEDFMYVPILLLERCSGLHAAIGDSLKSTFTKRSTIAGHDVEFQVDSQFDRLPTFLTVNYLRFSYKDQAQKNCKVFRKLTFPFQLDIFEYCTEELKKKCAPYRQHKRTLDDMLSGSVNLDEVPPPLDDDDFGCNNTGIYSLRAVITHKGRTTNSGHYVAWVRRLNVWFKCDDANVSVVSERDVAA